MRTALKEVAARSAKVMVVVIGSSYLVSSWRSKATRVSDSSHAMFKARRWMQWKTVLIARRRTGGDHTGVQPRSHFVACPNLVVHRKPYQERQGRGGKH